MRPGATTLTLLALLGSACAPTSDNALLVSLRTDLVGGQEYVAVEAALFSSVPDGSESPARRSESAATVRTTAEQRVAAFTDLEEGVHYLRLRLRSSAGAIVLERDAIINVRGITVATIFMTRDCRGVTCPAPDGDASLLACLAGRCVDPRCTVETPEHCGPMDCMAAGDCRTASECAEALCEEGICLAGVRADACGPAQWCHPEMGCQMESIPFDASTEGDSGVPDANDSSVFDASDGDAAPTDSRAPDDTAAPDSGAPVLTCADPMCGASCTESCDSGPGCVCAGGCPCSFSCRGENCEPTCSGVGTRCDVTIVSVNDAEVGCADGAQCDVSCDSVNSSELECETGASCLLRCSSTDSCRLSHCAGGETVCADGAIVCNRACP